MLKIPLIFQVIDCLYGINIFLFNYTCVLTLTNPTGFDSFTEITGTHLSGFNDHQVVSLSALGQSTTVVPR
jgi:hypothetical protein